MGFELGDIGFLARDKLLHLEPRRALYLVQQLAHLHGHRSKSPDRTGPWAAHDRPTDDRSSRRSRCAAQPAGDTHCTRGFCPRSECAKGSHEGMGAESANALVVSVLRAVAGRMECLRGRIHEIVEDRCE